jgi:hypothetical protein
MDIIQKAAERAKAITTTVPTRRSGITSMKFTSTLERTVEDHVQAHDGLLRSASVQRDLLLGKARLLRGDFMKRFRFTWTAVTALAFSGVLMLFAAVSNQNAKMFRLQTATGVLADLSIVNGSAAKLTRSEDAVWLSINTTGLPAGAYTLWWVIFNNPEACINGCSEEDLANPAVMGTVFRATGGVVSSNGVGHFRAHLEEGEIPSGVGEILLPGGPLLDAQRAEIHVVLRYHGPVVERILTKQTTTQWGGCSVEAPGFVVDPVAGDRLYPCYDPQAVMFQLP